MTGLLTGHEYYYMVQAIAPNGESVASQAIYVTTSGSTTFTISLSSSPASGGTLSGAGNYTQGKALTVTATPASGYEFVNWTEGTKVASTSASYTFTVNASRTLVANFKSVPVNCDVTLVANPEAGGTLSGGGSFAAGSSITVKASTSRGYEFVNWTDGSKEASTSQAYTFTVNSATTLMANFKSIPSKYTVTLSASPLAGGTVSGGGTFNQGSPVTATATPAPGYEFVNWTEGTTAVSTSASYTFTLGSNRSLTASFTLKTPVTERTEPGISVYPNPVSDILIISGLKKEASVSIISLTGSKLITRTGEGNALRIDVRPLNKGLYLVYVENNGNITVQKILVK